MNSLTNDKSRVPLNHARFQRMQDGEVPVPSDDRQRQDTDVHRNAYRKKEREQINDVTSAHNSFEIPRGFCPLSFVQIGQIG